MTRVIVWTVSALFVAAAAEAHVSVQPRESKAGVTETYTVRVPTEGKVATTSVELEIPEGVTISSVDAVDGVKYEMKRDGNRVVAITWTTEIEPGASRQFSFTASNPAQGVQIMWKAHQRYGDGSSRDWVDAVGGGSPASVTTLVAP